MSAAPALAPLRSPKAKFITGHLTQFSRDPLGFMTSCIRDHGDIVPLTFMGKKGVLIGHPDYVEQLLSSRYRDYIKHMSIRLPLMQHLLGQGLVASEGDFWVKQRKLVQPAFHRGRIDAYANVMVEYTERLLQEWRPGTEREIHEDMMRLTLEVVVKTMFDVDIAGEAGAAGKSLGVIMDGFVRTWSVFAMLDNMFPTPGRRRAERAVRELDEILFEIIRKRRESGRDTGDLLSMLLAAQDDDGAGMTDRQLRDESMTFFFAGHETTAITLSWTWYLLANHPEIEARFGQELETVLGGRRATLADLPQLELTERIVKESMRVYPPVWAMGREARIDVEVGGHRIPAGTQLTTPQWVFHRDPRWWNNAERFDPDRWLPERATEVPKYAYFPFGAGPRGCIGTHFAMMEAVLILATIGQKYRLKLAPNQEVKPKPSITLRPSGMQMVLSSA